MAIKVSGTEVVSNSRELKNIASIDSGTVTAFNSALNTDPTKGTLTKTFTQDETAEITLSSSVTVGPVVSATKEVPQTGISSKGAWDVNSSASNYDFHNTAANVTLTPTSVSSFSGTSNANGFTQQGSAYNSEVGGAYPQAFAFADNGMKYYIANNKIVYRYDLTTAYDLSTASINTSQTFNVTSSINMDISGIYFKNDGTKYFLTFGSSSQLIYAFECATGHDISNSTNMSSLNLAYYSPAIANPRGIAFKPDGTKMFVADYNSAIFEYTFQSGYAYNLGYVGSQSGAEGFSSEIANSNGVRDVAFTSDGSKMYILDDSSDENIVEYSLSTPWSVSTKSYTGNTFHYKPLMNTHLDNVPSMELINDNAFVILNNNSAAVCKIAFGSTSSLTLGSGSFASSDVGKRITGNGGDVILTSTAGAFNTTGGSAFTDSSTIAAGSWSMFGVQPTASGISINRKIDGAYNVSSSTISPSSVLSTVSGKFSATAPYGGAFVSPDGTMLFVNEEYNIRRYDMSTPHDLSTLSTAVHTYYIGSSDNRGLTFRPDGLRFYTVDESYLRVKTYTLSTAWDVSSVSSTSTVTPFSAVGSDNYLQNIKFNPDGTKMYGLYYQGNNQVQSYDLSTPYDVTTGSNMKQNGGGVGFANYNNLRDFAFVNNGSAALATRDGSNQIYYCEMTTPYDISTFVNNTLDQWQGGTGSGNASYITAIAEQDGKFYGINSTNNEHVWNWSIKAATSLPDDYFVSVTNSGGQIDTQYWTDINSMTADQTANAGTVNYAVSTDGRTTWSVAKGTDGVRPIVRNNSGTWQYNSESSTTTTTGAISTSTLTDTFDFKNGGASWSSERNIRTFFNNDGTRLYVYSYNNTDLVSYGLSTAYDMSTKGTHLQRVDFSGGIYAFGQGFGPIWNNDGTKLYYPIISGNIMELAVSTAYDLSTISGTPSHTLTVANRVGQMAGITWKPDGTKFYVVEDAAQGSGGGGQIHTYTLTTAYDLSTASLSSVTSDNYFTHTGQRFTSFAFADSGSTIYLLDRLNNTIRRYSLATAWDVTNATYQGTSYDIVLAGSSNDPCSITIDNNDGVLLVSDYGSHETDEYTPASTTTTAYVTTPTWADGSVNDELYTLQQALSVTSNRMDKTQLDAVADANHFSTGSSLDLMIALQMTNDGGIRPVSDGVTINFDAAALNEGAVLGTDYDFFHPAANKVQIKSLAAQNLKIRVV